MTMVMGAPPSSCSGLASSRSRNGSTDTRIGRCTMSDQNTTAPTAYADISYGEARAVGGKQASRRTFLKASGGLIAGAAAQVAPAAAPQGAPSQPIMGRQAAGIRSYPDRVFQPASSSAGRVRAKDLAGRK